MLFSIIHYCYINLFGMQLLNCKKLKLIREPRIRNPHDIMSLNWYFIFILQYFDNSYTVVHKPQFIIVSKILKVRFITMLATCLALFRVNFKFSLLNFLTRMLCLYAYIYNTIFDISKFSSFICQQYIIV